MARTPAPSSVQLFITCIVDSLYPAVGEAVVAVLERQGVTVNFLEAQTCCGQPGYNAGFRAEARQLALNFLDVFSQTEQPLIVPSGSCAAMIIHGYADLFADDPANLERARQIAARTYEFSQFLVDVLGVEDVGAQYAGTLTYHPSCHLARGLGIQDPPHKLLAHVQGAEVRPLPNAEECCGFGGLFAIKHGDVSGAILDKKLSHLHASGATTLVGCDMSCLMHLQGALQRDGAAVQCKHLAEVLRG